MVQFRLSHKFTKDLKIKDLVLPSAVDSVLDDWIIDVFHFSRRKIAITTHVNTLFTCLIPYSEVDNVKSIPDICLRSVQEYIFKNGFQESVLEIQELIESPKVFCKTNNASVMANVNDFKNRIKVFFDMESLESMGVEGLSDHLNTVPIASRGFSSSKKLLKKLLTDNNLRDK